MKKYQWTGFLVMLACLPSLAQTQNSAGKVIAASGDFYAVKGTAKRALSRKSDVFVGDVITTGANSTGQIRMEDGAILEIQADTEFRIDHYSVAAQNQKSELSLLKGGFKTLTGGIASSNPNTYQVNTANATMGVRGTYWGAAICAKSGIYAGASDCPATAVEVAVWGPQLTAEERAHKTCGAWIHSKNKNYDIGPCSEYSYARVLPGGDIIGQLQQSPLFEKGTSGQIGTGGGGTTSGASSGGAAAGSGGGGGGSGSTAGAPQPLAPVFVNNVSNITNVPSGPTFDHIGLVASNDITSANPSNTNSFILGNATSATITNPVFQSFGGSETITLGSGISSMQASDAGPTLLDATIGTALNGSYQFTSGSSSIGNPNWLIALPYGPSLPTSGSLAFFMGSKFAFDGAGNSLSFSGTPTLTVDFLNSVVSSGTIVLNNPSDVNLMSTSWTLNVSGSINPATKSFNLGFLPGSTVVNTGFGSTALSGNIQGVFTDNQNSGNVADLGLLVGFHAVASGNSAVQVTGGGIMGQHTPGCC